MWRTRAAVRPSCGDVRGYDRHHRGGVARVVLRPAHRLHVREGRNVAGEPIDDRCIATGRSESTWQGRGYHQRPRRPRPKPLGQEVVGVAARVRRGICTGVGEGEVEGQERESQHDEHHQGGPAGGPRPALDLPAPSGPEGETSRGLAAPAQAHPEPVDVRAGETEGGRKQGHRRRHDQEHGQHGPQRGAIDKGQAQEEQAEKGKDHGRTGEHHRSARGRHRLRHRFGRRQAFAQPLPVPGDDEQGVVDPYPEPYQSGQLRPERRHRQ